MENYKHFNKKTDYCRCSGPCYNHSAPCGCQSAVYNITSMEKYICVKESNNTNSAFPGVKEGHLYVGISFTASYGNCTQLTVFDSDNNAVGIYNKELFVNLGEYRDRQINSILE